MERNGESNKYCTNRNLLKFAGIFYLSSLIYGLILLKNASWTEKNLLTVGIIYTIIVFFDINFWIICIRFNLCAERTNSENQNENNWYQILDISEIVTILQRNFQVVEDLNSNNEDYDNEHPDIETIENKKTCLICSEEYTLMDKNNIKYIKLNCNHDFCEKCISKWCSEKNSCPLCRAEIINQNHLVV